MKKLTAAALGCIMIFSAGSMPVQCAAQQTDTLTTETQSYYAEWKNTYLRKNSYTEEEQYYVFHPLHSNVHSHQL